ncbi:EamA family transporter [Promicromonospora iranensis]|uniref:Drug/metabolite transporter (DMT)-like permease n=1 Tax=Promicromonospora iranensis TaxID=1105144 RepID=A0ABU2CSN0_9MICO|nr:DMT family transporter [Promicromonospora iranensis]MDR7384341.1 drug/metabolite transporter (DMT)-like permease [Promicromonospora iranensis]
MSAVTPDTAGANLRSPRPAPGRRLTTGLVLAGVSAAAFSLSGVFASGLLDTGWSPGAMVLVRVAIAALVVLPLGIVSLRGDWRPVRRNLRLITVYGVVSVAGCQFAYFSAVQYMPVGPALLIEYTAPAAVVLWFWLRHGQRPTRATIAGTLLAAVGLVLVLDLVSGTQGAVDPVGIAWALVAMLGVSTYFVINADADTGLPPFALAAGGLTTASLALGLLGATGIMPLTYSTASPVYAGTEVAWWLPLLGLGVVTAALAYVAGIAAGRRLGPRLSSFVGLFEVVAAIGFAWLLLDELPRAIQLVGGVLILAGVIAVQAGEKRTTTAPARPTPTENAT